MNCNKHVITQWHAKYKEIVECLGISQIPSHIWNCDETGLSPYHQRFLEKGIPTYQVTSAERGEMVTALGCFNAVGTYAPLLVIFRGNRLESEWAAMDDRQVDGYWQKLLLTRVGSLLSFCQKMDCHTSYCWIGMDRMSTIQNFWTSCHQNNMTVTCFPSHFCQDSRCVMVHLIMFSFVRRASQSINHFSITAWFIPLAIAADNPSGVLIVTTG